MASNQPAGPGESANSTGGLIIQRCTFCPSVVEEIDPEGDVILCVQSTIKLRVSTKILSVASPVLKAMFRPERFREGRGIDAMNPPTVCLPEDPPNGFRIICRSLYHLDEPGQRAMAPRDFLAAALLANKYLMRLPLGHYRPPRSLVPIDALRVVAGAYLLNESDLFSLMTARVIQGWTCTRSVSTIAMNEEDTNISDYIPEDVFILLDKKKHAVQQRLRVRLREVVEECSSQDPRIWSCLESLMYTKDLRSRAGQQSNSLASILTLWEREGDGTFTTGLPPSRPWQEVPTTPGINEPYGFIPPPFAHNDQIFLNAGQPAPPLPQAGGPAPNAADGTGPRRLLLDQMRAQVNTPLVSMQRAAFQDFADTIRYPVLQTGTAERVSILKFLQAIHKDTKEFTPRTPPSTKAMLMVFSCYEIACEWGDYTGGLCLSCTNNESKNIEDAMECTGRGH